MEIGNVIIWATVRELQRNLTRTSIGKIAYSPPDLDHGRLPDTIGETLATLVAHIQQLEERLNGHTGYSPAIHVPEHGVWREEDFAI